MTPTKGPFRRCSALTTISMVVLLCSAAVPVDSRLVAFNAYYDDVDLQHGYTAPLLIRAAISTELQRFEFPAQVWWTLRLVPGSAYIDSPVQTTTYVSTGTGVSLVMEGALIFYREPGECKSLLAAGRTLVLSHPSSAGLALMQSPQSSNTELSGSPLTTTWPWLPIRCQCRSFWCSISCSCRRKTAPSSKTCRCISARSRHQHSRCRCLTTRA